MLLIPLGLKTLGMSGTFCPSCCERNWNENSLDQPQPLIERNGFDLTDAWGIVANPSLT